MEGAFIHLGNHPIYDFLAAINASSYDNLLDTDTDESLLYGGYGGYETRAHLGAKTYKGRYARAEVGAGVDDKVLSRSRESRKWLGS